jgi:hypothetical protein
MRKSFDALGGIIRSAMHLDPLSDCIFVFKNKRGDRIKVVYWDTDGFAMWYKVLRATCKGARMNGIKFPRDPPSLSSRKAVTDRVRAISK